MKRSNRNWELIYFTCIGIVALTLFIYGQVT